MVLLDWKIQQFVQTVAVISGCYSRSTIYLGNLENVWTVQVRHLLALKDSNLAAGQGSLSRAAGT